MEKEMGTRCNILAWKIPWTEAIVHGVTENWTQLSNGTTAGPKDLSSSHPGAAHHCSSLYRVRL